MRDLRASPFGRGLILGLTAGLILGGLALLVWGARNIAVGPDCSSLTPHECALEREIADGLGRRQVLSGGALALLGLALGVLARVRSHSSDDV